MCAKVEIFPYFCPKNVRKMDGRSPQKAQSMPICRQSIRLTGISAAMHFLVDGLCICCLWLTTIHIEQVIGIYITYNVLAFLTQPLTGWWADRMHQPHWMLIASVVLLTLAVLTASIMDALSRPDVTEPLLYAMAVLLGIGNSLFHVWGGRQTAVRTENDIRAIGVFVSTGAFGLAIGAVFASWGLLYVLLLSIGVLALKTQALPLPSLYGGSSISANENTSAPSNRSLHLGRASVSAILVLIMLIVAGRSFAGEAFTTGITKNAVLLLVLGATAMFGKMLGGWFVKGLGMWKALMLMVIGAILCFIGKDLHIAVMLAGLFLVNCTMPITLYWANALLKGREGLAFGLLAAALMPGYLIAQPTHAFWGMSYILHHTSYIIHYLLFALLPTILIELGVLWLLMERRRKVLLSSIAVNVLTNVPLNLALFIWGNSIGHILIGEVIVFIIETLWYWYFTRNLRQATIYSFLCNAISFLIGLLGWSLLTLCNT